MSIAILSNIFSNRFALDAIASHARKQGVEKYIFTGGLFEWGNDPLYVASWLMKVEATCILTQKDLGVFDPEYLAVENSPTRMKSILWNINELLSSPLWKDFEPFLQDQVVAKAWGCLEIRRFFPHEFLQKRRMQMNFTYNESRAPVFPREFDSPWSDDELKYIFRDNNIVLLNSNGADWLIDQNGIGHNALFYGDVSLTEEGGHFLMDTGSAGGWRGRRWDDCATYLYVDESVVRMIGVQFDSGGIIQECAIRNGEIPWSHIRNSTIEEFVHSRMY